MNISYCDKSPSDALTVVGVFEDNFLTISKTHPLFDKVFSAANNYKIINGESIFDPAGILIIGLGKEVKSINWQHVGGSLFQRTKHKNSVAIIADNLSAENVRDLAYGFRLKAWRFETYHTSFRPLPAVNCKEATFVTQHSESLQKTIAEDNAVVSSVHWARQISSEPGNIIYPASFATRLKELESMGVVVEIINQQQLTEQKFGALLGVGQGSINQSCVVTLSWNGAKTSDQPITFVGKGVTFDSGGLSLKPAGGMEDMKMDKSGAVVVSALIRSLALRKAKVNAVAVVGLVENMPSGAAQRPGDIVTSLSGQTIEVLNTDAEGRLVLADVLWYAQEKFNPLVMVDVATLTGAVRVALGNVYAAVFSNTEKVTNDLIEAGKATGELLWPMPLHAEYDAAINSDCADMKNISGGNIGGGSCTAAQFLKRFIKNDTPWAHLDIASVDNLSKDSPLCGKGASGFGVRLLDKWIRQYESD